MDYGIVLQGTLGEFSRYPEKFVFIEKLINRKNIKGITIAAPSLDQDAKVLKRLEALGIRIYIGEDYNVARRILNAHKSAGWEAQPMVARLCSSWNLVDLDLVDEMMKNALDNPCDYLCLPKDFDYTIAADIASQKAMETIAVFSGDTAEECRAMFNPWSYIEAYSEKFETRTFEAVPTYSALEAEKRLSRNKLIYDENEFFGRDYAGSRYDGLVDEIDSGDRVLDMATGSGHGTARIAQKAAFAVGVDYLPEYIQRARTNYPENKQLKFQVGDAEDFLYEGGRFFSLAVSLHTIEHVTDERQFLKTLYGNLIPKGRLILEVPIMMARPWGRPTNPYHLREYSKERIEELVVEQGFQIEKTIVGCRGIYLEDLRKMRG